MVDVSALRAAFHQSLGKEPRIFSAPGRVNLIGEHTDYNDGFVLPMAIDKRTFVASAANDSRAIRVRSLDLNEQALILLDEPSLLPGKNWSAYVAGMAFELEAAGIKLSGADCWIKSEVPIGAGLSSSAALEISIGKALLAISHQEIEPTDFALLAQAAEHKYVGTHCGIMDQLTVVLGKRSHALLIDCRSRQVDEVGLNLPNVILVICNTNLKHNLATSAYNQRRKECEQAVEILRRRMPAIRALRDVTPSDIEKHAADLGELLEHRARHVVTENERTLQAAKALGRGDTEELGRLMSLSHRSLRDDYQVSTQELDLMVDLAGESTAVLGSRLTGGGFGGCTVNLVVSDQAERFAQFIRKEYARATGIEPGIYFVEADDGVREER